MHLAIYEILDEFKAAPTRSDKIRVLRENDSKALRYVLYLTFHPSIQFYTTEFPHYYKPNTDSQQGFSWSHLGIEMRRIPAFIKDHPTSIPLTAQKKEELLTQLLEALEPREAEIVIAMFRKQLPAVDLTQDLVNEAFPNFLG